MIKVILGVLLLFFQNLHAHTVRVKMKSYQSDISIQAKDLTVEGVFNIGSDFSKSNKLKISISKKNNKWLWTMQSGLSKKNIEQNYLKILGTGLKLNDKNYPATLILYPIRNNKIEVIAYIELEQYLMGVLPSEMPASWPTEALKAQAVASRSYTLSLLRSRKSYHYDLNSSVLDQVFSDVSNLGLNSFYHSKVSKIISGTRGEYLRGSNNLPVKTYYHADCGGVTEQAKYVWGGNKSSITVVDAFCPLSPFAKWSYDMVIGRQFKYINILNKTPSGRVNKVELVYKNLKTEVVSSQKFRELVGFSKIKSTFFRIQKFENTWHVWGKGHGHGVGMCQWGSKILARKGLKYKAILKHYYPLSILSSDRLFTSL